MALKKSTRKTISLNATINVTPFVDVMLVLLIIFMVCTPMMQSAVVIHMPQASSGQSVDDHASVIISLDQSGKIFLRDEPVDRDQLISTLKKLPEITTQQIYIRAEKTLTYDQVIQLMTFLASQGFHKLMLVTETPS